MHQSIKQNFGHSIIILQAEQIQLPVMIAAFITRMNHKKAFYY